MVKRIVVGAVLISALLTSCTPAPQTPIEQDLTSSGIVFKTSLHTLIPRNLSTKAVPYFESGYSNNRKTADSFFHVAENWASIRQAAALFLEEYPRAYGRITEEELTYAIAGVLYDELFRRDFADDAEEEALRKGISDENFFWNTLGIAQISPAIHKETISKALQRELTLEEAAKELLSSDSSILTIPHILYDNHPSNLELAVTRYHAGNVPASDERAVAILGQELRKHLETIREQ